MRHAAHRHSLHEILDHLRDRSARGIEHLAQHAAERIDVGARAVLLAVAEALRRGIAALAQRRRVGSALVDRHVLARREARAPEVDELRDPARGHHDVLGREITVHHGELGRGGGAERAVGVREPRRDVGADPERDPERHGRVDVGDPAEHRAQREPVQILHRQQEPVLAADELVHVDHVGVREARRDQGLVDEEALGERLVLGPRRDRALQDDRPPHLLGAREHAEPDLAHPAAGEARSRVVAAQRSPSPGSPPLLRTWK
jgi:hypothetical protein